MVDRRGRGTRNGRGRGRGQGTGPRDGRGNGPRDGRGDGRGQRLRRRDGSCIRDKRDQNTDDE